MLSCPQEYFNSLLCPLLGPLFAYMQQVRAPRLQFCNTQPECLHFHSLAHNLMALLLFHTTEAQRQVAGHQPEELGQVSCSIMCLYVVLFIYLYIYIDNVSNLEMMYFTRKQSSSLCFPNAQNTDPNSPQTASILFSWRTTKTCLC